MRYHSRRRKPIADINVVPYIDVMLVLLIIFMVTAPMLVQGVDVTLPQASAQAIEDASDESLTISLLANGTITLDVGTTQPLSLEEVQDTVSKILRHKPNTNVLLWGDTEVPYGDVVHLMAALQAAGAEAVSLVTEPEAR